MPDYIIKFKCKNNYKSYTCHAILNREQYNTLLEISDIKHGSQFDLWEYIYMETTDIIAYTDFPEYEYYKNKINMKQRPSGLISVLDFVIFNEY